MNCINHPEATAVAVCGKCENPLCEQCAIHWKGSVYCKPCLESGNLKPRRRNAMEKSPGLAAFLSLMPGLGQIYVGYYINGFINVLVVAAIITLLSSGGAADVEPFFGLFLSFFWIFNMVDAWRRAKLYNLSLVGEESARLPSDNPLVSGIILALLGLVLTLRITFGLELDFLEVFWPLLVLGVGIYLLWKYYRTRQEMAVDDASEPPPDPSYEEPDSRD